MWQRSRRRDTVVILRDVLWLADRSDPLSVYQRLKHKTSQQDFIILTVAVGSLKFRLKCGFVISEFERQKINFIHHEEINAGLDKGSGTLIGSDWWLLLFLCSYFTSKTDLCSVYLSELSSHIHYNITHWFLDHCFEVSRFHFCYCHIGVLPKQLPYMDINARTGEDGWVNAMLLTR